MKIQVNRPSKAILFLSPKNKKADSKLLRTLSLSRINFFSGLCTRPCLRETFIITSRQSKITHSSHAAFFQKSEMCPPAKNGVTVSMVISRCKTLFLGGVSRILNTRLKPVHTNCVLSKSFDEKCPVTASEEQINMFLV